MASARKERDERETDGEENIGASGRPDHQEVEDRNGKEFVARQRAWRSLWCETRCGRDSRA